MLAWFQSAAGASGDMMLGALVDAGASVETIQEAVDAVVPGAVVVSAEPVSRHGLAATRVRVAAHGEDVVRTWGAIRAMLENAFLAEPVRERALDAFERLARAEGAAHRVAPERVHFHEVGALDAIADIVGTCAALHALGVTEVVASPVALGSGTTRGAHGLLPVPGPAVLELLREAGAPVYSGDVPYELCTPTGAALLAASVSRWGGMPPLRIAAAGTGAGSRDPDELPNVLRVVLGERAGRRPEAMLLIETNIDDMDPRLWPGVLAKVLDEGAVDTWLTPIVMKKGRPAHTLSVLVDAGRAEDVRRVIFTSTSTLGVRERSVERSVLDRTTRTVDVGGCAVRVKLALTGGAVVGAQPEFEDVAEAAQKLGRPVKSVLAQASAAAQALA
ncbi:MAG: nickel pincer cofactor biosynthesis protein LarC [Streptosporangiaceae bacterium]